MIPPARSDNSGDLRTERNSNQPEYVSAELAGLDLESEENLRRLRDIIQTMQGSWTSFEGYQVARRSIAEKIDIYADFVRR